MKLPVVLGGVMLIPGLWLTATLASDASHNVKTAPVSADPDVSTTQMLRGKRLFFDEHERVPVAKEQSQSVHLIPAERSSVTVNTANEISVPTVGKTKDTRSKPLSAVIRFDALVESETATRVIINGIPCERVNRTGQISGLAANSLSCSSLNQSGLQLLLLDDRKSVRVLRDAVEIGVLTPGRRL